MASVRDRRSKVASHATMPHTMALTAKLNSSGHRARCPAQGVTVERPLFGGLPEVQHEDLDCENRGYKADATRVDRLVHEAKHVRCRSLACASA